MQLELSFSVVRCKCGATRQAEQPCPSCGCDPNEVDEELQRRRAIVTALELVPNRPEHGEAIALEHVWGELREWLSRFMAAFESVNDGTSQDAAARLQTEVDHLTRLRARVDAVPRRRPHLAAWGAVDRILGLQARLAEEYTRALVCPTRADVQAKAEEAQSTLDEATLLLNRFNAVAAEKASLDEVRLDDEFGDVVAGARAAFNLAGATNLFEFEESGAPLYERITGDTSCPTGFGVRLQMANLIVESSLDEGRFWSITRATYEAVMMSRATFELLAKDEAWRRDFIAVGREAREAGIEAAAISEAAAANRRRDLRAGIRLGAVITERLAPCLAATLLATKRRTAYSREKSKDVGTLLRELKAAGLGDLATGIDLALRDADAHAESEIVVGGVKFSGTRREYDYLTDDELLDRVLLGFESFLAMNLGITAALPQVGVEHEELEKLMVDKPVSAELVRVVMTMNGWTDVAVERDGDTVHISGTRDGETPTGVAASIVPALDSDVSRLIFEARGIGRKRVAEGPVAPYRRGCETNDPQESYAASLEALATWRFDGRSPIAGSALRKAIALTALESLDPSKPQDEAMAALGAMADLVERLDTEGALRGRRDRTLAARVADARRLRRQSATAIVSRDELQGVVDGLVRLAPAHVPPLRTTW